MIFDFKTVPARFIERPNRYVVRAEYAGALVTAHCADPGRLEELLIPGVTVHISPANRLANPLRRTDWDLRFVTHPENGQLVSLDTRLPNRIFEEGLRCGFFPHFAGFQTIARERPLPLVNLATPTPTRQPHSRIDFRLDYADAPPWWIEVKSATLVESNIALFPDAVTARGRRHLRELAALAQQNQRAAVVFIVQRPDADALIARRITDPAFADALNYARASGVTFLAATCQLSTTQITLDRLIPVRES